MAGLLGRADIAANDSLLRELYGNYCKNMQQALSAVEPIETEAANGHAYSF